MKKLVTHGIVGLQLLAAVPAGATTCRAQVIHTPCGSGKIEISFDQTQLSFELHDGDIHCWSAEPDHRGVLESQPPIYPHRVGQRYKLVAVRLPWSDPPAPGLTGQLFYSPDEAIARLELEPARVYNLVCDQN